MTTHSEWAVTTVAPHTNWHSIHSYFTSSPESPDGTRVLFHTSATREGHNGDLRIIERVSGRETLVAENIHTEDAHRVAYQQWIGDHVVYQTINAGRWKAKAKSSTNLKTVGVPNHGVHRIPIQLLAPMENAFISTRAVLPSTQLQLLELP